MSTGQLAVAFAGAVRHARQYATVLGADPRVRLVGMADADDVPAWVAGAGADLCDELGVPWVPLPEILRPDAVDLVVVCTEPTRHAATTIAALRAGLSVCSDKPLATNGLDADAVAAEVSGSRRVCAVVNRTFAPALRRLRSWVDAGHLGLPRHVDVEFLTSGAAMSTDVETADLVVDPALSGGGEMRNFLGYAVDAIRFVTGLEIIEVYAEAERLFDGPHGEHGVEDSAIVSMQLADGVTATATVSRCPAVPTLGTAHSSIRLIGSHGHAVVDDESPRVLAFGTTPTAYPVDGGGGTGALAGFFDDLVDCLVHRRAPSYTVDDARAGVAVVDAAYASAVTADPVPVRDRRARPRGTQPSNAG